MRANDVWGRRLSSSLDCAQFVDVLHFSLFAATVLQVGDPARASIATVLESLLAWLSPGFRVYLTGVHAGVSVAAEGLRSMPSQAPRALQVDPDNMTRRRIHGNAAWQVLERAKIKGITPREYLEHNETDVSLTVCPSNAGIWEAIDCELFMNNSSDSFQGCKQLSVAFDPSTYSGEDTRVAVAYNLRNGMSTVAIKTIPRSKAPCLGYLDVEDDVAALIAERKIERWSSYKEMRAVSSIVSDLTGMPLDAFKLGDGFHVRAVGQRETRILNPNRIAVIVQTDAGGAIVNRFQEMPTDFDINELPVIVVYVDQGRVGLGGLNFCTNFLKLMLVSRFDAFHRGIRDIIDSSSKAVLGVFRRVMLFTAYIFGLNCAPFGKGLFFDEKKDMLEFFYSCTDHHNAAFRKYAVKYAEQNGMSCSTDEDYLAVYNSLVDMESFNFKRPVPKQSRWYAWWDGYVFHIKDLWALKMVIEVYFEDLGPEFQLFRPDRFNTPEAEMRALKGAAGGFKLAYKIITHEVEYYAVCSWLCLLECALQASRGNQVSKTGSGELSQTMKWRMEG